MVRILHSRSLFLIITAILCLLPCITSAAPIASSDFSSNVDEWNLSGDTTSSEPTYVALGGNPGGFVRGLDETVGGVWYWDAPTKFLGDVSRAYSYNLAFDLRMRGSGPLFSDSDVILAGSGITLHFDTSPIPTDPTWTSYLIPLSDSAGWKVGSLSGPSASQPQILSVLSDLDQLRIRGEFITGSDNGDLDNVVLNGAPVPIPATLLLFSTGIVGLAGIRIKRRQK